MIEKWRVEIWCDDVTQLWHHKLIIMHEKIRYDMIHMMIDMIFEYDYDSWWIIQYDDRRYLYALYLSKQETGYWYCHMMMVGDGKYQNINILDESMKDMNII